MQQDKDFYTHLGKLTNGPSRQKIYRDYKAFNNLNFCFELNGTLRAGNSLSNLQQKFDEMKSIFRAQNLSQMVLYRKTSSHEFTPGAAEVALGMPFKYPAFFSTTLNVDVLKTFT